MALPNDPKLLADFYMLAGASEVLTTIINNIDEFSVFHVDEFWEFNTPEYKGATAMLSIMRAYLLLTQAECVNGANQITG